MKIFEKEYSDEELYDVSRDVIEAFDSDYNEKIKEIEKICPKDEYGFSDAIWKVTITYEGKYKNS